MFFSAQNQNYNMKNSKNFPGPGEKKTLKDKKDIEPKKEATKKQQADPHEKITNGEGNSKDKYFPNQEDPKALE
jgi:hypothetical protein